MELQERREAAPGGGDGRRQAALLYTIPEAAAELGIPVRTLRDWIARGSVTTIEPLPPARGTRISEAALELLRPVAAARGGDGRQWATGGGEERRQAAAEPDSGTLNEHRHDVSPGAAGFSNLEQGAEIRASVRQSEAEKEVVDAEIRASLQRERDHALADVAFLRSQLEGRAQAESELRRLMAALTETNRHLTGMLELKCLPPAVEATPRRVRWWSWWRR